MNIYVGNLNYRVKESDLQKAMEDYGTVSSVKFINDRTTGRFRGIAFVEMEDDAAAAKAIAELDGAEFFGRISVSEERCPSSMDFMYPSREAVFHSLVSALKEWAEGPQPKYGMPFQ